MAKEEDKGLFDRLGDILNAPLPGTRGPAAQPDAAEQEDDDEDTLLERIKDILSTPLPGTPQAEARSDAPDATGQPAGGTHEGQVVQPDAAAVQPQEKTPELDEDDLDEDWWREEWAAFRTHQQRERSGLEMKQQRDLEQFMAYQQQEKQRFETHQQQELDGYTRQQHWRMTAWQQAVAARPGQKPPPPPWGGPNAQSGMPAGGPPRGPMGAAPPWLRRPGPARRR